MLHSPHPIAITPGEPAGIGPDLLVQIAQQALSIPFVVIADTAILMDRAHHLGLPLQIKAFNPRALITTHTPGTLVVQHVDLVVPSEAGVPTAANAPYVLQTLQLAVQGCLKKQFAALVTGPVHKGILSAGGIPFTGHTEYLATLTNTPDVVMMLVTEGLRVALVTTHLPLSAVASAITSERLEKTLRIIDRDLQGKFHIKNPRIFICGLNPHAGDAGYLGNEEITIIEPVLRKLRDENINVVGPLAADTIFTPKYLSQADVIVAMYHDQGLPVLKFKGFGHAVNVTLGLPIIRTSVDHGTAFDLVHTGKASADSLLAAITLAWNLIR